MSNLKKLGDALVKNAYAGAAEDAIGKVDPTTFGGFTDLATIIEKVLNGVSIIAGLVVFIYLIMGGFEFLSSAGETEKVAKAQKKITFAIIGLIVILASYAIAKFILNVLGVGTTIF